MKRLTALLLACLVAAAAFAGCSKSAKKNDTSAASSAASATADEASKPASTSDEAMADGIDYMVLVNKTNALPQDWEEKLTTVHMTNSVGVDVEVEQKAYAAYLELKADLEKENIYVDLDSARRSVAEQQRIMTEFIEKYGAEYAAKTVAQPGFSEHHTGLALDLYLIVDGQDVTENEDMVQYTDIWAKIHEKLADYGFILRYLEGSEHITGYGYEPWHIRYIDDPATAKQITDEGVTFEEYLGKASSNEVQIDLGTSEKFSQDELEAAAVTIKCQFAAWEGCELKSLRYAGDEAVTEEKLTQLKAKSPSLDASKVVCFLMDFSTSETNAETALEPNRDYTDYQWWLSKSKDGWQIADQGYGA